MKKNIFIGILLFSCVAGTNSIAQEPIEVTLSFCGYQAPDQQTSLRFTREEIDNCDLVLRSDNPMYTVQSFEFTIVPWVIADGIIQVPVAGDRIPSEYRTNLTEKTKHIFIEKILAVSLDGNKIYLKPFIVRMQSR